MILWRIQFAHSTAKIFSKPEGAFTGNYFTRFRFGWKVSSKTKYKHLKPYDAALEEIGEWYE
jgi:intein-encoded DNA endonuclease-like protein